MELDKDLAARQEARALARQAERCQHILADLGASGKRAAVCVKMQKEDALSTSLVAASPTRPSAL